MVEHHLPDGVLVEYAAGVADPGHALIAACHLTLCPRCRERVAEFEDIGAALGLGDPCVPGDTNDTTGDTTEAIAARVLAGLRPALDSGPTDHRDGQPQDPPPPTRAPTLGGGSMFPWPLQRLIGAQHTLAWRRRLPGLRTVDVTIPGAKTRIRMVEAKPGMTVVAHGHRGLELDLVLAGGLQDRTRGREFERGDIQCSTEADTHELGVLPGEPCILLTINDGPFVPSGLVSRLVYRYLGWS